MQQTPKNVSLIPRGSLSGDLAKPGVLLLHYTHSQDNMGKLVQVWIKMRQEMTGFWDTVVSAGPCSNNLHLAAFNFLQAVCCSWYPTNSVKALKAKTEIYKAKPAITHTHPFNEPFPGLPRSAGTRKVKPIWILLKQETVSDSGISWAIYKSASGSRQITTPVQ